MRHLTCLFLFAALTATACAAPPSASDDPIAQSADQSLTAAQKSARTSVRKAVQHWGVLDDKRVTSTKRAALPAKAGAKYDEHLGDEDWDTKSVFEVYSDATKKTLVGYAFELAFDNGDNGTSLVMGFDAKGGLLFKSTTGYAAQD